MELNIHYVNNLDFASNHSTGIVYNLSSIVYSPPHELDHLLFSPPSPHELKPNSAHVYRPRPTGEEPSPDNMGDHFSISCTWVVGLLAYDTHLLIAYVAYI